MREISEKEIDLIWEQKPIDVSDIPEALLLATLYNNAMPVGLGYLHYCPEEMTIQQAQKILDSSEQERLPGDGSDLEVFFFMKELREKRIKDGMYGYYFDYLHGRCMKSFINGKVFSPIQYDINYGLGYSASAINAARDLLIIEKAKEKWLNDGVCEKS